MTGRKVLVTGSNGLIGRAVVGRLRALGADVTGVSRSGVASNGAIRADLTDATSGRTILNRVSPTAIVHLAGAATGNRAELYRANVVATRNLLEAVARVDPAPAVIVAGSAAEYGDPMTERVGEDHPTNPLTDYGRSKLEQSKLAQQMAEENGLLLCLMRPFNIVSRELPTTSALGNMRGQLVAATEPHWEVRCGRLDIVRDFIPLHFVVQTVVRLLELDQWPTRLNVCSGTGIKLGDVLFEMASQLGVEPAVVLDPELATIPAAERIIGDASLLRSCGLSCEPTASSLARVMIVGTET